MAKFSARSIEDLNVPAALVGRLARGAYFVVEIEADDGSWCEMDAEDSDHAKRLADNMVDVMGARGASCWCVNAETGALARTSFYTKFEEVCFD